MNFLAQNLGFPMNAADSVRRLPIAVPHPGQTAEVAPGVFWLRFPLPFKLNHVNIWLIREGGGWTVVDTGIHTAECRAAWKTAFSDVLGGLPVRRVIATHFHPDHVGLAGWLGQRFDAPLWMPEIEWRMGRLLGAPFADKEVGHFVDFYRRAGFSPALDGLCRDRVGHYAAGITPIPDLAHALTDGETFPIGNHDWTVLIGRGHSPAHAGLYCKALGILISGDQILPEISPNISVWPVDADADPLGEYLESLPRFLELPAETLVLPSHRWPFTGLHLRARQLLHHHDDRLAATSAACAEPRDATTVLRDLFERELDDHQLFFAIGETLAHLHYLMHRGVIQRTTAPDGVHRYVR